MLNLIVTTFLLANIFRSLEHSVGTWSICHKVCISLLRHSPNVNWSTHSNVSANSPPEDSMCTCNYLNKLPYTASLTLLENVIEV